MLSRRDEAGQPARGLHGVHDQRNAGLPQRPGDLLHRLHNTCLIMGEDEGSHSGLPRQAGLDETLRVHGAGRFGPNRDQFPALFPEGSCRSPQRSVLQAGDDHAPRRRCVGGALQGSMGSLRPPGSEENRRGGHPGHFRHLLTGFIQKTPRLPALLVSTGGVGPTFRRSSAEHLPGRITGRSGGVVIQVNARHPMTLPSPCADRQRRRQALTSHFCRC